MGWEDMLTNGDSESQNELATLLKDRKSAARKSAAKRIRKMGDPETGKLLLPALEQEVTDPRTWETQYHMIMGLAECGVHAAQPLLERVLRMQLEPMVHLAAGDALVRLSTEVDEAVLSALRSGMESRIEGAARALAMTGAIPDSKMIDALISYASDIQRGPLRFWVAAAAASWPREQVRPFLESAINDSLPDTRRAAEASLQGRRLKWRPL